MASWGGGRDGWDSGGNRGGWDSWPAADDGWRSGGAQQGADDAWAADGSAAQAEGDQGDAWASGGQAQDKWGQAWGDTDWDQVGEKLDRNINWNGIQLKAINKCCYAEHPAVRSRSPEQVEEIRRSRDIEVLSGVETIPNPITTFEESSMPDWFLAGIVRKNFKQPTPIQVQVWPAALQGRDLIGIAETGSGKTLAYILPMMVHIMSQEELKAGEGPVGVVMCPTRELALQIDSVAKDFAGPSGLRSTCVYGGSSVKEQGYALQEKNDIVVATPGRFIQLLNDGWTNLNRVTFVVLDEADEMLTRGFEHQVRLILSQVRPDRQIMMFSATWPRDVQKLAEEHCTATQGLEPVFIRTGGDKLAACRTITQNVLYLKPGADKFDKVREAILRAQCDTRGSKSKCLIFCRTKLGVDELVWRLNERRIEANSMHGDKPQDERIWALKCFKDGHVSILVSTNCLGRGHDIPQVKFVINYDAPDSIESYVHRIGRTGRAGEQGYAMTFITDKDFKLAPDLVEVLKQTQQKVPDELLDLATSQGPMSAGEAWDRGWSGGHDSVPVAYANGNDNDNGASPGSWGGYVPQASPASYT